MTYRKLTRDEHFQAPGPKRILALDGGGLKGIVSVGFLRRVEEILRNRHGNDPDFRLCHYFDLIAGTSTGAIIAAMLAKGMTVAEITGHYLTLGTEVFERSWFRKGLVRARYDDKKLRQHLRDVLGKETLLGDESLRTGILLVTKRMDTGSPWPLGNNPRGRYFRASEDDKWVSNADYPLWQVVRASTAAPSYFNPETFTINEGTSRRKAERGEFVDGGVSPFNNPSLQAFMYATLDGYHVNWPSGADNIFLLSVGTGRSDPGRTPAKLAASGAVKGLLSIMDDCGALVETMMQWMSASAKGREIDRELGDLRNDLIAPAPLLTYVRYNVSFKPKDVEALLPGLPEDVVESLNRMDETKNLRTWKTIGELAAEETVENRDFPRKFDLPHS